MLGRSTSSKEKRSETRYYRAGLRYNALQLHEHRTRCVSLGSRPLALALLHIERYTSTRLGAVDCLPAHALCRT